MQILHLHTWWASLAATCAGGVFPSAIGTNTPCTGGDVIHCNLWWWSIHIIYIYICNMKLSDRRKMKTIKHQKLEDIQYFPDKNLWRGIQCKGQTGKHLTYSIGNRNRKQYTIGYNGTGNNTLHIIPCHITHFITSCHTIYIIAPTPTHCIPYH